MWYDAEASSNALGATLTLPRNWGNVLLAALAILVTFAGSRSWKLWRYILHQARPHHLSRSAFFRQQEVLLRNIETDLGTLWWLLIHAFAWRKSNGKNGRSGRPPSARFAATVLLSITTFHAIAFLALGVLSSLTATGNLGLARGNCEIWVYKVGGTDDANTETVHKYFEVQTDIASLAIQYAKECYKDGFSMLGCDVLSGKPINWTGVLGNDACPFGQGKCAAGDKAVYKMQSGPIGVAQLGLNLKSSVTAQRISTCAVLDSMKSYQLSSETAEQLTINATLERHSLIGTADELEEIRNYFQRTTKSTQFYTFDPDGVIFNSIDYTPHNGYQLKVVTRELYAGRNLTINAANATIEIAILQQNGVYYRQPVDDPWFSTVPTPWGDFQTPEFPRTIACADQVQFCRADDGACDTPRSVYFNPSHPVGTKKVFKTPEDELLGMYYYWYLSRATTLHAATGRGAGALVANNYLDVDNAYFARPTSDMWIRELDSWFETSLAFLQIVPLYTSISSGNADNGTTLRQTGSDEFKNLMCNSARVRARGYTSFCILWLGLIVGLVFLIFIASFLPDLLASSIVGKWRPLKLDAWQLDSALQLLRTSGDNLVLGNWEDGAERKEVPISNGANRLPIVQELK